MVVADLLGRSLLDFTTLLMQGLRAIAEIWIWDEAKFPIPLGHASSALNLGQSDLEAECGQIVTCVLQVDSAEEGEN